MFRLRSPASAARGTVPSPERSASPASRRGGVVEGAQLTDEGSSALYRRFRTAGKNQAPGRAARLDTQTINRLADEAETVTCEAPLPPTLTDNWIDAINARLVRTRTGLHPVQPSDEIFIGSATSYFVRLYGEASGYYNGLAINDGDLARVDLLIDATFRYCMDPDLGIAFVERALAEVATRPAERSAKPAAATSPALSS